MHRFLRYATTLTFFTYALGASADVFDEAIGARTLAMGGAHRGLGTSNETLWLNPAGMALTKRYGIDSQYSYGTADRLNHLTISAVDSKSGPLAGGVAYTRDWGNQSDVNPTLNRLYLGGAFALGGNFALGVNVSNVRGAYRMHESSHSLDAYNATLGMGLVLADFFGLGVVYQNIFHSEQQKMAPPTVGVGSSLRLGIVNLAADWVTDIRDNVPHRDSYHFGGEFFLFDMLACRAGYSRRPTAPANAGPDVNFVSGGLGIVNEGGGFNASIEKALVQPARWEFITSLQFFI